MATPLACTPTLLYSPTCPVALSTSLTQLTLPTPCLTCPGLLSSLCPALHTHRACILHSWGLNTLIQ